MRSRPSAPPRPARGRRRRATSAAGRSGRRASAAVRLRRVSPRFSAAVGLAPGATARLDHARGVAAVLGLTLALGLGHAQKPSAFSITWRAGSKPGIGRSRGKPSSAARGARPTSSARATGACRRTTADDLGERQLGGPLDVHRHLRSAARRARSRSRARPGRPSAPPSRISGRDRARVGDARRRRELQVERDERLLAATSVAPALGCKALGPKSGTSPADGSPPSARHSAGQLARRRRAGAPRAFCRARPALGELAVEEHRHAAAPRRCDRRRRAPRRTRRLVPARRDGRSDTTSTAPTCGCWRGRHCVAAPLADDVRRSTATRAPAMSAPRERAGRTGEREHGAIVVGDRSGRRAGARHRAAPRYRRTPARSPRSSLALAPRRRWAQRAGVGGDIGWRG